MIARTAFALAFASAIVVAACASADGDGHVAGSLNVPDCWSGKFDLQPDFFAGVPYRQSLTIRIQRGSDLETFSDGISILVDDISKIRPDSSMMFAGTYGLPIPIDIPASVTPPGVPLASNPTPANVHLVLYMQKSCQTQNVALYAVQEVTLPDDTSCDADPLDAADPTTGCSTTAAAGKGSGKSTISFTSLFDGDPNESNAAARLSKGCFDVYLADPREVDPGGKGPPPICRGHLHGSFSFYFQRGRPEQPFP